MASRITKKIRRRMRYWRDLVQRLAQGMQTRGQIVEIRMRRGFTLVEVALFLALTAMLFMGIVLGTGNSIENQRFNDTTQGFAEFIRSVYSQVANPQGVGDGRSDKAIYGKMISFGQKYDTAGGTLYSAGKYTAQKIFVYDVVGGVGGVGSGAAVPMLKALGANVAVVASRDATGKIVSMEPAGLIDTYEPKWSMAVEDVAGNVFAGTILIVRHPTSGTIHTLYSPNIIEVNDTLTKANATKNFTNAERMLTNVLDSFTSVAVNFCINPNGFEPPSDNRRNVRIIKDARNASGVEVINLDDLNLSDGDSGNVCRV